MQNTHLRTRLFHSAGRAFAALGAVLSSACALETEDATTPDATITASPGTIVPSDTERAELVDGASIPGRLVVNGAFVEPDASLRFPDGATITVTLGPNGMGALNEVVPAGARSRLNNASTEPVDREFAALAPHLDLKPLLERARTSKVFVETENALRDDVRQWLSESGKLEQYVRVTALAPIDSPAPIASPGSMKFLADECAGWTWFKQDFWNNASHTSSHKCKTSYWHDYDGYDHCNLATMNNRGPNAVSYIHRGRSLGVGTNWGTEFIGSLNSREATMSKFRDLDGWNIVIASCRADATAEASTQVNGLGHRWD